MPNHNQCSFCGKSYSEVKKLLAGPAVYICNECIVLGTQILNKKDIFSIGQLVDPLSTKLKSLEKELTLGDIFHRLQSPKDLKNLKEVPVDNFLGKVTDALIEIRELENSDVDKAEIEAVKKAKVALREAEKVLDEKRQSRK